jgi:hypothetical protein
VVEEPQRPSASRSSPAAEPRLAPDWGDALEAAIMRDFGDGAENFCIPSALELQAFRSLVGELAAASQLSPSLQRAASHLDYRIREVSDGMRRLWALEEAPPPRRGAGYHGRGWGTVLLAPASLSQLVIEVPHPGFDLCTPQLGWQAFVRLEARALLVAGAVRGNHRTPLDTPASRLRAEGVPAYSASDPTHATATAFEAAHEALAGPESVVVQLHGFSATKHHAADASFAPDLQAVLSDGADDGYDPPLLAATHEALTVAGYRCHLVAFDSPQGRQLGATANVQGRWMRAQGLTGRGKRAEFVHLELDSTLRRGADRAAHFGRLLEALARVLAPARIPHARQPAR